MDHIQAREYLSKGDIVEVACSHQCNIRLLDDANYRAYKSERPFRLHDGGPYKKLPARLLVPHTGYWNIVIDLGGATAQIRHSIRIITAAP